MSWATRHKIIYFCIFAVLVIIIVGIPAFFIFYKAPTCTDGRQNGQEDGVDCGGLCQRLCYAKEQRPVIYWQQAFNVQGNAYSAVAYVQNPNPNAEAFDASYTFTILDAASQVILEKKGRAYIPPGRNFAVFESGIRIPDDKQYGRTLFEFDPEIDWLVARRGTPVLRVLNQVLANASTSPSVDVDIQNPSFAGVKNIEVAAILYDNEGNAFAASKTYIDSIPQESSRHVVFTWPKPFASTAARIEVIPFVR